MYPFVGQTGTDEVLGEGSLGGPDNEVDHFERRVDDAQRLSYFRECDLEEATIEVFDDALAGFTVVRVNALDSSPDRREEVLKPLRLSLELMLVENVDNPAHGDGHWVGP